MKKTPEHKYAKLYRRLPAEHMPSRMVVSTYDKEINILYINQDLFDQLDPLQQRHVLRSENMVIDTSLGVT